MPLTKKKFFTFATLTTLTVFVAGCGGDKPETIRICQPDTGCREALTTDPGQADYNIAQSAAPARVYQGEKIEELTAQAQSGDASAAYLLGTIYEKGLAAGQSVNRTQAQDYFRQSADQGYAPGQHRAGLAALRKGDYANSVRYFTQGANAKDPNAALALASLFDEGKGVEKNEAEAFRYYKIAADAGSAVGAHNTGLMMATGRGTEMQPFLSGEYLKKAASRNIPEAQKALGFIYARGLEDHPKDLLQARRWLSFAAGRGDAQAKQELEYVQREIKEEENFQRSLTIARATASANLYAILYGLTLRNRYYDNYSYGEYYH